jgi:serine/threonine-protein kinase
MARKRSPPPDTVICPDCGYEANPFSGAVNFCPGCGADLRGAAAEASRSGGFVHRVIADRYRLVDLVGEGGMGAVYRAEHIRMGKVLALKILRGDFAASTGAVDRFLAEAQIVSRLSHPHTIAVFDFGEIDDAGSGFYLAMEYVPGKDLATVLREDGPLPEARVVEIGQQILGSLGEAHDAGIVHRDMKPGNVMLMKTRSGEDWVKVLDFGIAKLRGGPDGSGGALGASTTTTNVGAIIGTPNYLAPEQARAEPIDGRADLYAVGCLLYELACGHPPFVAPAALAVVQAHLRDEPPPLQAQRAGISRRFAEVIHRALRKRPEERFRSADEMREALGESGEPTGMRPLRAPRPEVEADVEIASRADFEDFDRQVRSLRRSRVLAPVTIAAALAALGLVAWRWADVYGLLARKAPAVAAALPAALRPASVFDGEEHEPNDVPAQANPLPLPPGPDGRPGGGLAEVRGHIGAKLGETSGDVDIFRIEVPPTEGPKVLVADWHGEKAGEGIRGLDVALALNRERAAVDARTTAPLVASVNRGGPGRPERLVAAVEPGVYYLSVREHHSEATGPVEKPTDWYVLAVRLVDPMPGEELEPNDGPDRSVSRFERYPEWRATAIRNRLGEGVPIRGDTAPDDPDLFAVEPRDAREAPEVVLAVPEPGLALTARLWTPDAEDLAPPATKDRVRFEDAGSAGPGEPLLVRLEGVPAPGEPALLELRAEQGSGRYVVVALGRGPASGAAALALVRELGGAARIAAALEVAGVFGRELPGAEGPGGGGDRGAGRAHARARGGAGLLRPRLPPPRRAGVRDPRREGAPGCGVRARGRRDRRAQRATTPALTSSPMSCVTIGSFGDAWSYSKRSGTASWPRPVRASASAAGSFQLPVEWAPSCPAARPAMESMFS